ncbi:MAG: hypothetical protein ACE5ID_01380 [Acidobacteriota bacterium]
MRKSSRPIAPLVGVLLLLTTAAAEARSRDLVKLVRASGETPEAWLLDIGIQVFDAGLSGEDKDSLEKKGISPDVRKSEARFIPFHLKNTLESTGHWGAVRVVPTRTEDVDLTVTGTILESTGMDLVLKVKVEDSRGTIWQDNKYTGTANPDAYGNDPVVREDPFQSLYNSIANDMLDGREDLSEKEIHTIQEITRIRFAADLAPAVFARHLGKDRKGRYRIVRLPSPDDPMMRRIGAIRQRDDMFVDTLNEYYSEFYTRMAEPYRQWRQSSYEEQKALQEIRRKARRRKWLGGLLDLGGIAAGGGGQAAETAREAAVIGGVLTVQSGIEKGKESQIHAAALKELAASFGAEIGPTQVEVEGQTLRLQGSAEAQFSEWRRIMAALFANETGTENDQTVPPDVPASH